MGHDMMVSRYAIPTGISCIDRLSTGPPGFRVSHHLPFVSVVTSGV